MSTNGAAPKANIKDVAALAGVSPSTVSNYYNRPDVVQPDTQERIQEAARKLGYVRNESARRLRSGYSRTFALLLLDAWIPFYSELSRGVEDVAEERGWTVVFSNTARNSERERRSLEFFESQGVQGTLIIPHGDVNARLRELQRRGLSCVTLEQSSPAEDISSVTLDDIQGGRLAGEHLASAGRDRLAFVGDPSRVTHVADRYRGFCDAAPTPPQVLAVDGLTMGDGVAAGRAIAAMAPDDRPAGVFAANDLIALGLLQSLLPSGISVPKDIALVGYDDIAFAAQAAIPLTTVRQPAYEMGRAGATALIDEMEGVAEPGDQHVVFQPELVIRDSSTA